MGLLLMLQHLVEHGGKHKKRAAGPASSSPDKGSSKKGKKAAAAAAAAVDAAAAGEGQEGVGAWLPELMACLCEKVRAVTGGRGGWVRCGGEVARRLQWQCRQSAPPARPLKNLNCTAANDETLLCTSV